MGDQVVKIGEAVKRWQEEKGELEARIVGFESFQKLVLEQPDEVILGLIKDVKRQLRQGK
jgi:flagellar assembly factor FliW